MLMMLCDVDIFGKLLTLKSSLNCVIIVVVTQTQKSVIHVDDDFAAAALVVVVCAKAMA